MHRYVLQHISGPFILRPELRLLEGVDAFCASICDAMVALSFEVKQKVLQLVVQRIVVEDHRITIEHVVPSGPLRLQPEHHVRRNIRLCATPWPTRSCMTMNKRANIAYLISLYCKMTSKLAQEGGWNGKNLETVICCVNAPAGPERSIPMDGKRFLALLTLLIGTHAYAQPK